MPPTQSYPAGAAPAQTGAKPFRASPAQEQLWALLQQYPDRPIGNFPVALNIEGPLDAAALGRALNDVVARHDIFRTSFDFVNGRPIQLVAPLLNFPMPVIDLRLLPSGVREAQAFRLAREDAARVFDVRRLPLLRTHLFLFEQTRHILVLTFHRAIFDQEALGIFLRELSACYEIQRLGGASALPPLALQYPEYAGHGPDRSTQAADLAWWSTKLAGEPAPVQLPSDRTRTGTRRASGRVEKLDLSAALRSSVEILALRDGTNPYTILLTAFQVLLHRYTNLADFVMGLGASDRHLPGMENLLGPCARVVPCRADLSGNPKFRELLERVRGEVLEIFNHAARLSSETTPGRFRNAALACPVQFFHERRATELAGWPGLRLQELELDSGACSCELAFHLVEGPGGWSIRAEYDAEAFSPTVIQQLLAHFTVLLQAAVARPTARLSELPLLTSVERRRLLNEWNNTVAAYPRDATVHELISIRAVAEPAAVAVVSAGRQLTYRELDQRSNQLGRHLRAAGIRPGRLVGLGLDRSPEFVVALLGILKAGGAVCPFDPALPLTPRLLRAARLNLILTQTSRREQFFPELNQVLLLDGEAVDIHREDDSMLAAVAGPDDFAWLAWTNGTGGEPKPVELSHRAIISMLYALRRLSGIIPADVVLSASPLGDVDGLTELLLPLAFGARLELAAADDLAGPARLAGRITSCQPTLMQASPSVWSQLIEAGWTGEKSLRIIAGGEPLARELANRLLPCCRELWNVYGAAETGGGCLATPVTPGPAKPLVGRPLGNVQVHVLDAHLQPVPVGLTGEIYVGGEALATGYRDHPAETIAQFPDDPFRRTPGARLFRTGDLARRLPNGEIEFLARLDQRNSRRPSPFHPAPEGVAARHRPASTPPVPTPTPRESASPHPVFSPAIATSAASAA